MAAGNVRNALRLPEQKIVCFVYVFFSAAPSMTHSMLFWLKIENKFVTRFGLSCVACVG